MWSVLGRAGNSNTAQRIALMQRYLSIFKVATVKYVLADGELIGAQWLDFLNENNIPFIIRVKAGQIVTTQDGKAQSLHSLLRTCRGPRTFIACFGPDKSGDAIWFTFAAKGGLGRRVQKVMRGSYSSHYRPMLPKLLDVLYFRSNNTTWRPVLDAKDDVLRDRVKLQMILPHQSGVFP